MPVEWKAGKVESILGFLDQYDWEGLFDTKGVPVSHRDAYKVRAEAMHAFRRKILEAVVDPSKASRIADWKRELQALAVTDPMEYESFDKWRRALQAGEHAHHGRGGLNVLQNVGKLPNAAQYDLHQALKEGYDTVIGQPKSKGPIILSNWMHKGSKSINPWEIGSVLRSAHREGTSGLGRFSLMMNPQSTGSSLAQQLIRNTGHYADWDDEAWKAYRASHDYIRQSGLEGKPLSQLSDAVTSDQPTQRLLASEQGVADLPTTTTAAEGTEKLVDGTKVAEGTEIVETGGKRFVQKYGKWIAVAGAGFAAWSFGDDAIAYAQEPTEHNKARMQLSAIGLGGEVLSAGGLLTIAATGGTATPVAGPVAAFGEGLSAAADVGTVGTYLDEYKKQIGQAIGKHVIPQFKRFLVGNSLEAQQSRMSYDDQVLYEAGGGQAKQKENRLTAEQVRVIGRKNLELQRLENMKIE